MNRKLKFIFASLFLVFGLLINVSSTLAEDKPAGRTIPKLPVTANDPELVEGHVYPFWGPICQRYTYSVIYRDKEGRPPEYVQIYFNGEMIDMEPTFDVNKASSSDYQKGVRYEYKFVPNKRGSNFYFFEASNGLGKARESIIESPDNGPVLFDSAFDQNEIAVIDVDSQKKILSYNASDEWVGGVALSNDGKYLAAKTNKKVYLFDTSKPDNPLWAYQGASESPGDVKGGVAISADGSRIFASIGGRAILFANKSEKPIWVYEKTSSQAYNVAVSKDGKYLAMATAGEESNVNSNLLILWNEKSKEPLWQYHSSGNFHDVSLSENGNFIAGATGCPDRRFYIFSKDSNVPLIKSEMLTRDSPVHRSKISSDGSFAAVGSESDDGAVFLFSKDSSQPLWKFPTPQKKSVRALNFTPDGKFIGASTFGGDAYIFSYDSSVPVSHWKVDAALGGLDISDNGKFIATGGTDNKVHVFSKDATQDFEVDFNEYVEEIDISANGKYIAVGTGGSVYFFESVDESSQAVACEQIKEPPPESEVYEQQRSSLGGLPISERKFVWPGMLFGFGFAGSLTALIIYLVNTKYSLFSKIKTKLSKKQKTQETPKSFVPKPKHNKKIIIILSAIAVAFLLLTIISIVLNTKRRYKEATTSSEKPSQENLNIPVSKETEPTQGTGQQKETQVVPGETKNQDVVCGNSLCEPDYGETKENCPSDCSSSD